MRANQRSINKTLTGESHVSKFFPTFSFNIAKATKITWFSVTNLEPVTSKLCKFEWNKRINKIMH